MKRWKCPVCKGGFVIDIVDYGSSPNDLQERLKCPLCGVVELEKRR